MAMSTGSVCHVLRQREGFNYQNNPFLSSGQNKQQVNNLFQFNLESNLDGQTFLPTERSCGWALVTLAALFRSASWVTAQQDVDPP